MADFLDEAIEALVAMPDDEFKAMAKRYDIRGRMQNVSLEQLRQAQEAAAAELARLRGVSTNEFYAEINDMVRDEDTLLCGRPKRSSDQ